MTGFIYTIRRFKSATVLNFIGLVIAMFAYYVLMTQINYTCGYNKGLLDYENLYRVENCGENSWGTYVNRPSMEKLATDVPQVESIALLGAMGMSLQYTYDINGYKVKLTTMCYRTGSLETFGVKLVDGSLKDALSGDGAVIPASVAKTYFGKTDVAGETIYFPLKSQKIRIVAVYEDFPENCSVKNVIYFDMKDRGKEDYTTWSYNAFVRLKDGADPVKAARAFEKLVMDNEEKGTFMRFTPVADTYMSGFDTDVDKGSPGMLMVLQLSCLMILLVAVINFANFTLAEAPSRVKSITTHRMLGGNVWLIRLKLVFEGIITSVVAMLVALVGIAAFGQFHDAQELFLGSTAIMDNLGIVAQLVGISVAIGLVATVYPSWYLTSFPMVTVMKSSFATTPKGLRLRRVLVGIQLLVSTILICFYGITNLQKYYVSNCDFGYDKDEVLYVEFDLSIPQDKKYTMKEEVQKIPGVESASLSQTVLGLSDLMMSWGRPGKKDDETLYFRCLPVDADYLRVYGMEILEGRDFHKGERDVAIVNDALVRKYPYVKVHEPFSPKESATVVGICNSPRAGTAHSDNANSPAIFLVFGPSYDGWGDRWEYISIRVGKNVDKVKVKHEVEALLSKYWVEGEPECHFLDQDLDDIYREDFVFISQVTMFSAMALAITLIGVFCLTMFETEYRRKEIAIRKVLGCSETGIISMLVSQYIIILFIAFAIASPIAWILGNEWLQSFEERTVIYWWIFPLALIIIGFVLVTTIVVQSWKVANMNPMESVRTE